MPTSTNSPTLSRPALWLMARYALAIVLALACVEVAIRLAGPPERLWYPATIASRAGTPLRTVFVGSSRVQAAIDPDRVIAALPAVISGTDVNFGQGFSTIVEHTIGLRELADQGLLDGATVFVEAPGGVADVSRWTDRWYYPEMPDFLIPLLRPRDIPPMWRANVPREDKLAATIRSALSPSVLFREHELIRVQFLTGVDHRFRELSGSLASARAQAPASDIRAGGGVRTDLDDRERIRAAAVEEGQRMLREQILVDDWRTRVVATLVETVRRGGGDVIFFETPLSRPMRLASETEVGRENRRRFEAQAAQWGTRVIPLRRDFADDEFPDVWHLSRDAAAGFTDDVVRAWRR